MRDATAISEISDDLPRADAAYAEAPDIRHEETYYPEEGWSALCHICAPVPCPERWKRGDSSWWEPS